jgi:formylglycine-generating enzyme required for sulfatase activity
MVGTIHRESERKSRIFISYSRNDMAFVDRLESALRGYGFEPLIDRAEIYAFEDWWKRIENLIGRADTIVFVVSPDAVASEVTRKEIVYASSLNKRFAPIVYRRVEDAAVPEPLRRLNFIFFDDPDRFEANINRLADALHTDIHWIRQQTEFGEVARRWSVAGRPGPHGLLLRSPVLEQAEHWIGSRPASAPVPGEEVLAFIAQSRRAANRRRRRIQAVAGAFIATIVAGLWAWWSQIWLEERFYALTNVNVLSPGAEHALKPKDVFKECGHCPEMIVVPTGHFTMGSPTTEKDRDPDEGPQHEVSIGKSLAVAKYETTFAEWDTCVRYGDCDPNISDSDYGRNRQPVINVSWDNARVYIAWLNRITGKPYRLLTEAEWEYAARAGTTTAYYWGNDVGRNNANCNGCGSQWDNQRPAPVGSFAPNAFGVYDMAGNVFELTQDCWNDDYVGAPASDAAWLNGDCDGHVIRAGTWNFPPAALRAARRDAVAHEVRAANLGFRVARELSIAENRVPLAENTKAFKP